MTFKRDDKIRLKIRKTPGVVLTVEGRAALVQFDGKPKPTLVYLKDIELRT